MGKASESPDLSISPLQLANSLLTRHTWVNLQKSITLQPLQHLHTKTYEARSMKAVEKQQRKVVVF